ncbi:MAG: hypothetical protein E4G89_06710, partial [Methanothrix sp.]
MNRDIGTRALARKCGMPYIDIENETPDHRCLELLKEVFAKNYNSLPMRFLNGGVLVAIGDPMQKELIETLTFHMGKKVYPALAERDAIFKAIHTYYPGPQASLVQTKENVQEVKEAQRDSRIISIISNKGGVGK